FCSCNWLAPANIFTLSLHDALPIYQQQLNLISYAVNYAATVDGNDNWSFAWKGLTGQYLGEYSLMPYYRKVKEYGDFESRDLWEDRKSTRLNSSHVKISYAVSCLKK